MLFVSRVKLYQYDTQRRSSGRSASWVMSRSWVSYKYATTSQSFPIPYDLQRIYQLVRPLHTHHPVYNTRAAPAHHLWENEQYRDVCGKTSSIGMGKQAVQGWKNKRYRDGKINGIGTGKQAV